MYLQKLKEIINTNTCVISTTKSTKIIEINLIGLHKNLIKKVKHNQLRAETITHIVVTLCVISETTININVRNDDLIDFFECFLNDIKESPTLSLKKKHHCVFILCSTCVNYLYFLQKNNNPEVR